MQLCMLAEILPSCPRKWWEVNRMHLSHDYYSMLQYYYDFLLYFPLKTKADHFWCPESGKGHICAWIAWSEEFRNIQFKWYIKIGHLYQSLVPTAMMTGTTLPEKISEITWLFLAVLAQVIIYRMCAIFKALKSTFKIKILKISPKKFTEITKLRLFLN